jgi:hypothetical protein
MTEWAAEGLLLILGPEAYFAETLTSSLAQHRYLMRWEGDIASRRRSVQP